MNMFREYHDSAKKYFVDLAFVDAPRKPQLDNWSKREYNDVRDTMDYLLKGVTSSSSTNTGRRLLSQADTRWREGCEETKYQVCHPFFTGTKPPSNFRRANAIVISRTEHWWIVKEIHHQRKAPTGFTFPPGVPNRDRVQQLFGKTRPHGEDWQSSSWVNIDIPKKARK